MQPGASRVAPAAAAAAESAGSAPVLPPLATSLRIERIAGFTPGDPKALGDLAFTANVIFPGGRNPRLEELVQAVRPKWEIVELRTQRKDYGKTTGEWLRRMREHETYIRETWGDQLFDDYERYLDTTVRGFDALWSSDVQMKLVRL